MRFGRLKQVIQEDNVNELAKIFNSINEKQKFNALRRSEMPLLLFAVKKKSQKVVEYLLSQDFVDKRICNQYGENIYQLVCCV